MNTIDVTSLPNDVEKLKSYIVETISSISETYETKIRYYQEQLRIANARYFGRTSEKIPEAALGQRTLFDEAEVVTREAVQSDAPNTVRVDGYVRNKVGRKPLPADLPREEKIIDLPEEEKIHSCGKTMVCIGEEVSEKLCVIPQKMFVEKTRRKKYACPCEGADTVNDSAVRIAPMPAEILPKSQASASLLAYIITSKFCDALPLYRLESIFSRAGVDIPRQNMSFWIMSLYDRISPLRNAMLTDIRGGPLIGIDETPVQVMKEPGRKNTTKSYMWVACGTPQGKRVVLYTYAPTRSAATAVEILGDFHGTVQCDGFSAYNVLLKNDNTVRAGCWAHVRRKFVDAKKAAPKESLADEMISMIGELYGIEQEAIERGCAGEELRVFREERSLPIIIRIRAWLDEKSIIVTPSSTLGKAIRYALNEWNTLTVYLHNGHVRIDNNHVENAIRPFVLGRKNWLFSGSPHGAHASALFYSLIETAKANGLEPHAYLSHLFDRLPYVATNDELCALLPYRVTLPGK